METEANLQPSPNGDNGPGTVHDTKGRFLPGNPGGPGNPHAAAVAAWRGAMVKTVAPEDVQKVVGVLVDKAKAGEAWAVRELLDRCLGRPQQRMELEAAGEGGWAVMLTALHTAAGGPEGQE